MISRRLLFGLMAILLTSAPSHAAFGRKGADTGVPSTSIVSDNVQDRVFIHIRSDKQETTAQRIKERLQEEGYSVPRVILVASGPHENEVRYFHEDRVEANVVLHDVSGLGLGRVALKSIGHYPRNPPGRYELWLSPGTR